MNLFQMNHRDAAKYLKKSAEHFALGIRFTAPINLFVLCWIYRKMILEGKQWTFVWENVTFPKRVSDCHKRSLGLLDALQCRVINSSEDRRRLNWNQRTKLDLSCDLDLSAAGKSLPFLSTYCTVRSHTASLISNTVKTKGSWPRTQWKERVETCRDGCRVSAPHPQGALWMILRLWANQLFLVLDIFMSTKDITSFIVHWSPWYELFKASQSWFHSEYEPKGPEPKPLLVGEKNDCAEKRSYRIM